MTAPTDIAIDTDAELQRAARVLPNGSSSTVRTAFRDVMVRAAGSYVWTARGDRFLDCHLGFGAIVVGHCDPRINAAVTRSLQTIDLTGMGPHVGEARLAELICEAMPCAEQVAFCTSGSDATLHAVHLARAATGRKRLLKFHGSYHGWHDQLAAGSRFAYGADESQRLDHPDAAGLSPGPITVVAWNDIDAVRAAFHAHPDEFAAVFCEPYVSSYGCVPADDGFLAELRRLTTQHGSLLVFDEVKTAFRQAIGGYQTLCGVTPDIAVFAKAIANGFSLAGIAGTADVMAAYRGSAGGRPSLNGTYNSSPYAIAAGLATLEILQDNGIGRLTGLGDRLRAGLQKAIDDTGSIACVAGAGPSWSVFFRDTPPRNYAQALECVAEQQDRFRVLMLERGVALSPGVLGVADQRLALSTTEQDIDDIVAKAHSALSQLAASAA